MGVPNPQAAPAPKRSRWYKPVLAAYAAIAGVTTFYLPPYLGQISTIWANMTAGTGAVVAVNFSALFSWGLFFVACLLFVAFTIEFVVTETEARTGLVSKFFAAAGQVIPVVGVVGLPYHWFFNRAEFASTLVWFLALALPLLLAHELFKGLMAKRQQVSPTTT